MNADKKEVCLVLSALIFRLKVCGTQAAVMLVDF
jgi:hypothetical protein